MRTLATLAVLAPLALLGCKKSTPPESAPAEQAPPPAESSAPVTLVPTFTWGAVAYEGGHMSDSVGTLTMPLVVAVTSGADVNVTAYTVGVKTEDGRVCTAKNTDPLTISVGEPQTITASTECMYSKLPAGETVMLKGVLKYTQGGAEFVQDVDGEVAIAR